MGGTNSRSLYTLRKQKVTTSDLAMDESSAPEASASFTRKEIAIDENGRAVIRDVVDDATPMEET